MFKLFGDKAGEMFNAQAKTVEQRTALTHLAEVSPEQFVALFKTSAPDQQRSNMAPGQATGGEHVAKNSEDEEGTKAFYNKMRRTDPKKYYGRENQIAMLSAAKDNQEKYFGR
jgi:hypothetical protein